MIKILDNGNIVITDCPQGELYATFPVSEKIYCGGFECPYMDSDGECIIYREDFKNGGTE